MPSLQIPDFRTPGQPLVPLQLKLPPDELQALDALASKLGRTRTALARHLLIDGRRALARQLSQGRADMEDVVMHSTAARFIGAKAAELRKAAKAIGPGVRVTGDNGRTATFLGLHPGTPEDDLSATWWRLAEATDLEVG